MTTKTHGMTMAKASPDDFKTMWKISKLMQEYGYQFHPDDGRPRAVRIKNLIMARLDQLGSGGFMRIVMGFEMLIKEVCAPEVEHLALKPVLGAAPELLQELRNIANADTIEWDDRSEFEAWAKSRARAAIAKTTEWQP
nr:hypothetical protein [uncultured Rhodoferax sp.]